MSIHTRGYTRQCGAAVIKDIAHIQERFIMDYSQPLDFLPIWAVYLLTVLFALFFRAPEKEQPVSV